MSTLASVIVRDIIANRPAAGIPGRLFYATDTLQLYRDNGSTWDTYSAAAGGSGTVTTTGSPQLRVIAGGTITITGTH